MNKQEKAQVVDFLHQQFCASEASFVVNFQGLSVKMMQKLRKQLRNNDSSLKVAKARLMKKAAQDIEGSDAFSPYLKEQVGLVFAAHNAPAVAKLLNDFAKENQEFKIIAGYLDKRVFDQKAVTRIAQLPSRQVLLAQLCGTLNAPMTNFVGILHALLVRLVIVLKQIEEKKSA